VEARTLMTSQVVLFSVGFLVSVTLMFALRPIALRVGLVDSPGGRKTHSGEVPVIGGVAMFSGLLVAAVAGAIQSSLAAPLLAAAGLMVVVGLLDDFFDLPPNVRLLAHIAAAATLVLATGFTVTGLGDLFGVGEVRLGPLSWPFTVVAVIALINAFNMLDGMDGLAGGVGLVGLAGLAISFALADQLAAAAISAAMLGAVVAFLVFNVPAGFNRGVLAFMGDSGSTLLGFLLAGLGLAAVQPERQALEPVLLLWLMPIPIFELFMSTFRRIFRGRSPLKADRGHFHHALLAAGFSVRAIFITYLVISVACAAVGLISAAYDVRDSVLFLSFAGAAIAWALLLRYARTLAKYLPPYLHHRERRAVVEVSIASASRDAD
jgi:UDP-GlcNAc:undecaprenyl-phosphate/decaprenyl-phosphate GlcNAc-1-phosphate transferase